MKKMMDFWKNHLVKTKKHRISLNFLVSYLLILLAPVVAIAAVSFTARNAMVENQKTRIQNDLSEITTAFDREVKQAQNVGYYVSRERRLCDYLYQKGTLNGTRAEEFFTQYTIASNYPNYSLTNQVIKNVFILIADSQYVIKLPQVIPQTERGISTLEGFPFHSYESFMDFYEKQDKEQTLFYCEGETQGTLFLPCQMAYPNVQPNQCAIVVQLDWTQIRRMLRPVLAGKEGMVALLDENNEFLACYENLDGRGGGFLAKEGMNLETYLTNCQWGERNLELFSVDSEYNGWKLVSAVPRYVLTERIGSVRYITALLCVVSVFIGVAVCLAYWYQRKTMVLEYFQLQERMPFGEKASRKESTWFWKSFGRFLVDVDKLQNAVEQQEGLIKEDFLRRLLYGFYDSDEQVMEAAEQAGIVLSEQYYCVVDMEFEDPQRGGVKLGRKEFCAMLKELLDQYLPCQYWKYQISELSCVLLLRNEDEICPTNLKSAFEQINFEFYSRFKVQSYIGISRVGMEPLEISRQYEVASRIKEFARYRGIRVPVLPEEMPREQVLDQPLFFTIDMELKLVNQVQNGSEEQLEEMLKQIQEVYFKPGNSRYTYGHTIEILRVCLFRCIPMDDESPEAKRLCQEAQKAQCKEHMFQLLQETRQFCSQVTEEKAEAASELDRDRISDYIEEHFGDPCLNLCMLAEWLGEPERKLYNDFKLCFGMSFSNYLEQRRMAHACDLLKQGVAVKDTAEKVGYGSDYSFRRAFKRVVGIPPSDFRKMQTV